MGRTASHHATVQELCKEEAVTGYATMRLYRRDSRGHKYVAYRGGRTEEELTGFLDTLVSASLPEPPQPSEVRAPSFPAGETFRLGRNSVFKHPFSKQEFMEATVSKAISEHVVVPALPCSDVQADARFPGPHEITPSTADAFLRRTSSRPLQSRM